MDFELLPLEQADIYTFKHDIQEAFWPLILCDYGGLDPDEQNMTSICKFHHAFVRPSGNLSCL